MVHRVPGTGAAGLDEGRGAGLVRRRAAGPTRVAIGTARRRRRPPATVQPSSPSAAAARPS